MTWQRWTGLLGSFLIIAISGASLLGYALGHERFYRWFGTETPMALNTAIAFLVVGLSLSIEYWRGPR